MSSLIKNVVAAIADFALFFFCGCIWESPGILPSFSLPSL